uniref:Uncharacterized protein n=1 Tax=Romanomermis culicivorax TaxID=13658 RepID=A0A915INJ0_ROMCU
MKSKSIPKVRGPTEISRSRQHLNRNFIFRAVSTSVFSNDGAITYNQCFDDADVSNVYIFDAWNDCLI